MFKVFLWLGLRLFGVVAVWKPSHKDDEKVRVVHFATDEDALKTACVDYVKDGEGICTI